MKLVVVTSASALLLAIPSFAWAQGAQAQQPDSCPPGSWFCAPPQDAQPAPAGKQGLQPLPDPDEAPAPPPRRHAPAAGDDDAHTPPPPPVVVYQPPPPVMVERPENPPPYEYAPPPKHYISPPREWGLNLHLEGAAIGDGTNHDASMGGVGAGLRYKPSRYFGLEWDLDFYGGHGYVGDQRSETATAFNALVFLNPRSRAQLYLLGGFGWSWAHSQNDPNDPSQSPYDYHYSYFGGQAGIGLELRLTRVLAFNIDFRGFIRSRTDSLAQSQPEFTNAQGQSTNTSGGGLLTGGMTLYF
jgi:hypothetical protein